MDPASVQTDAERAMALMDENELSWWQATALVLLNLDEPTKVPSITEHPILKSKDRSVFNKAT